MVEAADAKTLRVYQGTRRGRRDRLTDEASAYKGMPYEHESVRHSTGEFVRDMAQRGIESFWSMLKRAHKGTFHRKHLHRYSANSPAVTHTRAGHDRSLHAVVARMVGKRLMYRDLIA